MGSRRKRSGCGKACQSSICTCIMISLGCLFLLIGGLLAYLFYRFTPMYQKMTCKVGPIQIAKISFSGGFTILLDIHANCYNPNPYTIDVESLEQEPVYLGEKMTPAAIVRDIPKARLPAHGMGHLLGTIQISPTRQTLAQAFPSVMSLMFAGEVPVYFRNSKDVTLNMDFPFGNFSVSQEFHKDCAVNVKLIGLMKAKVSPPACGNSFAELDIPSVRVPPKRGEEPKVYPKTKGEEMLEKVETAKNIFFAVSMAVCFLLGLVLICCKWFCVRDMCYQCFVCCCCCGCLWGSCCGTDSRDARTMRKPRIVYYGDSFDSRA